MDVIAREVEPSLGYRHEIPEAADAPSVGNAMSNAACDLAEALGATAILVPTFSGRTASLIARLRPRRPIAGLSHHQYSLQQMALEWGVTPLWIPESPDVEDLWTLSIRAARDAGLVQRRRPRRDHRGHAGQYPRLDQRDQGRSRVVAAKELDSQARTGRHDASSQAAQVASPAALGGGRRVLPRRARVLPARPPVPRCAQDGRDAPGGGAEAAREAPAVGRGSSQRRRATPSWRARRAASDW